MAYTPNPFFFKIYQTWSASFSLDQSQKHSENVKFSFESRSNENLQVLMDYWRAQCLGSVVYNQKFMTKRNIQITNDGKVKLIKTPLEIKQSIKRYSTTYELRQADDNNNLVRHSVADLRCLICEQFFPAKSLEHLNVCHHTFCLECLHNYILYKITVNQEIECPQADCDKTIAKKQTCYEQLPERYKKRYEQFKELRQKQTNSKTILCQASNCKGNIDFTQSSLKCSNCQFKLCNLCHLKKHEGSCDSAYASNFSEWRICPDCQIFNQKTPKTGNKTQCRCGHKYCFVCRENWTDAHKICSLQVDTSLDDQVFCRNEIMDSSRCWNFIKSIALILVIPFLLIFLVLITVLTVIGVTLFAIFCSPCLSFLQYDTCPKAFFCFPCVGVYKIGVFIKRYVGMICSISCDLIARIAITIKALCSYNKQKLQQQTQSNKIQYVN